MTKCRKQQSVSFSWKKASALRIRWWEDWEEKRAGKKNKQKKLWRLPWQEISAPVARDFSVADLQGRHGPHVLQGKIFYFNWFHLYHFIFCFVLVCLLVFVCCFVFVCFCCGCFALFLFCFVFYLFVCCLFVCLFCFVFVLVFFFFFFCLFVCLVGVFFGGVLLSVDQTLGEVFSRSKNWFLLKALNVPQPLQLHLDQLCDVKLVMQCCK